MTTTDNPGLAEQVAAVLAGHQREDHAAGDGRETPHEEWTKCSCGVTVWCWQQFYEETEDTSDADFLAHVAAQLVPLIEARERGQRAAVWTEAIYHAESAGLTREARRACMADNPYEDQP